MGARSAAVIHMNSDADVAVLTAQQIALLEAFPCYVFVQRGGSVVYANRVAREILHLDPAAVLPVGELFRGRFPGFVYDDSRGSAPVFSAGGHAYSSDFNCEMRTPLDSAMPVRGTFR